MTKQTFLHKKIIVILMIRCNIIFYKQQFLLPVEKNRRLIFISEIYNFVKEVAGIACK